MKKFAKKNVETKFKSKSEFETVITEMQIELKRKIDQGQNVVVEDIVENDSKYFEMIAEMFEL